MERMRYVSGKSRRQGNLLVDSELEIRGLRPLTNFTRCAAEETKARQMSRNQRIRALSSLLGLEEDDKKVQELG